MKAKKLDKSAWKHCINAFLKNNAQNREGKQMIDWDRIEELKSEVGEDDFGEVVAMFFEEVAEALERIQGAAPGAVAKDLHFIKGSALNIGLSQVSELCRSAEIALRKSPDMDVNVHAIQTAFSNSKAQFSVLEAL